jgi:probable HAF family extracellular repeat protein
MTDIGTLGGSSQAVAVNSIGQVIGNSSLISGETRGYSWTLGGRMVELGTLGGTASGALAENDSGQVVGWSLTATGEQHAALWQTLDKTPPTVSVRANPRVLWPPNHKLIEIVLDVSAQDDIDPSPCVSCEAVSSEPNDGPGDSRTAPDVRWSGGRLWLRAERNGTGPGRTYTITCNARDASGNVGHGEAIVLVPHALTRQ